MCYILDIFHLRTHSARTCGIQELWDEKRSVRTILKLWNNLSLELQRSAEDEHFTEELEEFLKIMDNNDVNEKDFYTCLEFEHCEVIRLYCDLLLMDIVNVSSRVRTINTHMKPDSKLNKFGFQNSDVAISNAKYLEQFRRCDFKCEISGTSICGQSLVSKFWKQFRSCPPVVWYIKSSSRRK